VTCASALGTIRAHNDDVGNHEPVPLRQWPLRRRHRVGAASQERTTVTSFWHRLTELAEVYARHASRHGPNRLLPAEVLPAHGCVPEHTRPSPQGSGSNESTAGHSTPGVHTTRSDAMENLPMAHEASSRGSRPAPDGDAPPGNVPALLASPVAPHAWPVEPRHDAPPDPPGDQLATLGTRPHAGLRAVLKAGPTT